MVGVALKNDQYAEELAALGVTLIVNNRPDGEMLGQPKSAAIEAAAREAGIDYLYLPVGKDGIGEAHLMEFNRAVSSTNGKTLGFCLSGMRSLLVCSYAEATRGTNVKELVAQAEKAGYNIAGHAGALANLAAV